MFMRIILASAAVVGLAACGMASPNGAVQPTPNPPGSAGAFAPESVHGRTSQTPGSDYNPISGAKTNGGN